MKFDTLVLGGGMVGVSIAVHLQKRGLSVALVDRKAPGNETSLGNAGLIQREGVYPYALPRDVATLARYARNRSPDVRYHPRAMPSVMPFLYRYWHHSRADRHAAIARAYSTLIEHCVSEHRALVEASGAQALLRTGGWLKVFRSAHKHDAEMRVAEQWRTQYGVGFDAQTFGQPPSQQVGISRMQPQQPLVETTAQQRGGLGHPRAKRIRIDSQRRESLLAQGEHRFAQPRFDAQSLFIG